MTTLSPPFASIFLTHLFAWPCGSIMSGHRFDRLSMIALSIENESFGSFEMVHARTFTSSPSVARSE